MVKTISPLLLAAGQSTRFGSDKLLHPLSNKNTTMPLIIHTLSVWLEVFPCINVVIRDDNISLNQLLAQNPFSPRITLITAPDAHRGMSSSLMSGIESTKKADGWLIGLADMPFVDKNVIQQSVMALNAGAEITQAEFTGRRGHPVGFSSRFLPELLTLQGDKGARSILHTYPELISPITSPDDGIFKDIDSRENV